MVSATERFENMGSVMEFKLFRNDMGRSRGMGRTLGVFFPFFASGFKASVCGFGAHTLVRFGSPPKHGDRQIDPTMP